MDPVTSHQGIGRPGDRDQNGFTLIEVLLTVAILAIGVVFIHQAFSRCIDGIRRSEERVLSSMILKKAAVDFEIGAWTSFTATGTHTPSLEVSAPRYFLRGGYGKTATIGNSTFDQIDLTVRAPSKMPASASFLLNQHGARTLKEQ